MSFSATWCGSPRTRRPLTSSSPPRLSISVPPWRALRRCWHGHQRQPHAGLVRRSGRYGEPRQSTPHRPSTPRAMSSASCVLGRMRTKARGNPCCSAATISVWYATGSRPGNAARQSRRSPTQAVPECHGLSHPCQACSTRVALRRKGPSSQPADAAGRRIGPA